MDRRLIVSGLIVTAVTSLTLAVGILVQQSFTKSEIETIASARRGGTSQVVTVKGRIKNYSPKDNTFLLSDPTGRAELYTCPSWYRKIRLADGEVVTITGHLLPQRPKIEGSLYVLAVHTIQFLKGNSIVLRTTTGKPPWANGLEIQNK